MSTKTCACGKPVAKRRKDQCEGCYQQMHRAGIRLREVEDLGPDAVRLTMRWPKDLKDRVEEAGELSKFTRDAVREKLERLASGT